MPEEPFFSVVIPTRNRAHLLRYALQSALDQEFDDYEIIVSDNCSEDNTVQIVSEAAKADIRYVRPDRPLSMPDHWNFALNQTRGKYVTYLCDDDALAPTALQRVRDTIQDNNSKLVVVGTAIYYGDNWFNIENRNSLQTSKFSGVVRECCSRDTLLHIFECRNTFDAPRMLNSFCDRQSILQVRDIVGEVFLLCPDYSFPSFMLTHIPEWTYIDTALRLQGVFAEGIGATQLHNRGEPSQVFLREFNKQAILERVPLKVPVVSNYIAETLLMAKERNAKLSDIDINWPQYFVNCWMDILEHERNGVFVKSDKEEFAHVLEQQPEEIKAVVRYAIMPTTSFRNRITERIVGNSATLRQLRNLIRKKGKSGEPEKRIVRGSDAGFSNILECSNYIEALAPTPSIVDSQWQTN
jgi:glycosyltransferase involved in cell wall biosynthesis